MTTVTSTYTVDVARPLTFRSAGEFSAYGLEGSSTVTLELEEGHSYGSTEVSLEELDALISYLTAVRSQAFKAKSKEYFISKVAVLIDGESMMVFVTNTENLSRNAIRNVVRKYLRKGNRNSNILEIDYVDSYIVSADDLEKLSEESIVITLQK